jgi:hypothetical protein
VLDALWRRLQGRGEEAVQVVDLAALPPLTPATLRELGRRRVLVAAPAVDPRAVHDAPALAGLSPVLRVSVANAYAVELSRLCPPYHAERRAGGDRVFLHLGGPVDPPLRLEVALTPEGAVGPPGVPPEAALDLDHVLRQGRFFELPTIDRPGGAGVLWILSVVLGGRHHLVRRADPRGDDRDLLARVLAALGLDLEVELARRRP